MSEPWVELCGKDKTDADCLENLHYLGGFDVHVHAECAQHVARARGRARRLVAVLDNRNSRCSGHN